MSRIYDALRRAELDRSADQQQRKTEPVTPADPAAFTIYEALEQAPAYSHGAEERSYASEYVPGYVSDELAAQPHGQADDEFVDMDNIASYPWTPVLERLPAAQDRGRTIEQFRSLRSHMQELRHASNMKSILVSSGLPQEGKSFVAANLAISFARHKISRVLLIDGDMRRSSQHKLLGCSNDRPGLTEYLSGHSSLQEIMQRAAPALDGSPLPAGLSSLVFIGAGSEYDKASDLSGNHRFDRLMATLAPHFDWVVVDSSPVNLVADGINLSRACDGVLLIARAGVTRFATAQRAVAELKTSKIIGFVLNAADTSLMTEGYYYNYDKAAETA